MLLAANCFLQVTATVWASRPASCDPVIGAGKSVCRQLLVNGMNSDSERLITDSLPGGRREWDEEKKLKQVRMDWACAGLQRPTLKTRWTAGPAASSCMRTERFFGVSSSASLRVNLGESGEDRAESSSQSDDRDDTSSSSALLGMS